MATLLVFMPIAKAKTKGGQLVFDEWTGDRIEENRLINQTRQRVDLWRRGGWVGVTPTTRALLEYWTDPARERRLFFRQVECARDGDLPDRGGPQSRRRLD